MQSCHAKVIAVIAPSARPRRGAFVGHEADALPAAGDVLDGFDGLAAAGRGDATALQRFLDAGAGSCWKLLETEEQIGN